MGLGCSKFDVDDVTADNPHLGSDNNTAAAGGVLSASGPSSTSSSHTSNRKKKKKRSDGSYLDPFMHEVMQTSIEYACGGNIDAGGADDDRDSSVNSTGAARALAAPFLSGQHHLLYSKQTPKTASVLTTSINNTLVHYPTRLVVRRRTVRSNEEGLGGTHVFAVRYPRDEPLKANHHGNRRGGGGDTIELYSHDHPGQVGSAAAQEQCPESARLRTPPSCSEPIILMPEQQERERRQQQQQEKGENNNPENETQRGGDSDKSSSSESDSSGSSSKSSGNGVDKKVVENVDHLFQRSEMLKPPKHKSKRQVYRSSHGNWLCFFLSDNEHLRNNFPSSFCISYRLGHR